MSKYTQSIDRAGEFTFTVKKLEGDDRVQWEIENCL